MTMLPLPEAKGLSRVYRSGKLELRFCGALVAYFLCGFISNAHLCGGCGRGLLNHSSEALPAIIQQLDKSA